MLFEQSSCFHSPSVASYAGEHEIVQPMSAPKKETKHGIFLYVFLYLFFFVWNFFVFLGHSIQMLKIINHLPPSPPLLKHHCFCFYRHSIWMRDEGYKCMSFWTFMSFNVTINNSPMPFDVQSMPTECLKCMKDRAGSRVEKPMQNNAIWRLSIPIPSNKVCDCIGIC